MKFFDKVKNAIAGPEEEEPQASHRANVLNEAIRKGQRSRPTREDTVEEKTTDDPRVAFIREKVEFTESIDPYNTSEFDRGKSWKPGGDR